MSAKSSLYAKVRDAALSLGRSDRNATRKARLLESASFSNSRGSRLNRTSSSASRRKVRHYVLATTKRVSKLTPTISARQYETKKARQKFGLSPEQTTQARRQGAIRYVSADQRERVAKAAITREETKVVAEIKKLGTAGERVQSNSPTKDAMELAPHLCRR